MFGGRSNNLGVFNRVQMHTLGKDVGWSYHSQTVQHPFVIALNSEIFYAGLGQNVVHRWNKTSQTLTQVKDLGYKRYGYSQLASLVPLDSGIEKWCLSNISDNCKTQKIDI